MTKKSIEKTLEHEWANLTFTGLNNLLKSIKPEDSEEKFSVLKKHLQIDTTIDSYQEDNLLSYDDNSRIVERFMGVLFTEQLIILSGPPGTGKTSLPFAVAKAIGAECKLIPVQPNWTDNLDLLGYYNPTYKTGRYVSTPFLDVLIEAGKKKNQDKIYFIVLDEMNLAHIEYYFSTMLSVMESNKKEIDLYIKSEEEEECQIQPTITFPSNVQIIGTLNMDETTKNISPKVIDRSYILEIGGTIEGCIRKKSKSYLSSLTESDTNKISGEKISELSAKISRILGINMSNRIKNQTKSMASRSFLSVDDLIAGKILPMVCDKKLEQKLFDDLLKKMSDYPISKEKIGRMKLDHTDSEGKIILNYWNR